jgi:hypothetical protein
MKVLLFLLIVLIAIFVFIRIYESQAAIALKRELESGLPIFGALSLESTRARLNLPSVGACPAC